MKSNGGRRNGNGFGVDIKLIVGTLLNTNPKRRRIMWLMEMYPGLTKQKLSAIARDLKKKGWLVEKRWNLERQRSQCWVEKQAGQDLEVMPEVQRELPLQEVELDDSNIVNGTKLETALSRMFEELYELRTFKKDAEKRDAENMKKIATLEKDNQSLTDDNLKLRSYGRRVVGLTPAIHRALLEFGD